MEFLKVIDHKLVHVLHHKSNRPRNEFITKPSVHTSLTLKINVTARYHLQERGVGAYQHTFVPVINIVLIVHFQVPGHDRSKP